MHSLILDSLEIRNFRAFRHLKIEHLGRVNLIVGKNNVGKTCLLEALWLYARRGSPTVIADLLEARDEIRRVRAPGYAIEIEERFSDVKYLFYGRTDIREHDVSISIGPVDSQDDTLSIGVGWYARQTDETGQRKLIPLQPDEYTTVDEQVLGLTIQMGTQPERTYLLETLFDRRFPRLQLPDLKDIHCVFTSAMGLDKTQIGQLWDRIVLTNLEEHILTALRIIAPAVERVSLVGEITPRMETTPRVPIVKIAGLDSPVPLRNLGEGMNRMFGIALSLINSGNGILLIDEIESGLHYSIQPDMWRLIFQVAYHLNVQVFATTHSWDCIEAFQQAAQEHKEEGLLIRLEQRQSNIVATLFDERRLGIAAREDIEVR